MFIFKWQPNSQTGIFSKIHSKISKSSQNTQENTASLEYKTYRKIKSNLLNQHKKGKNKNKKSQG